MTRHTLIALFILLPLAGFANSAAPVVVSTMPDNGETDVDPTIKEIRIEFDQPMNPGGRSVVGGGDRFPEISGDMKFVDAKTFVIPVKLQPDHPYQFMI